MALDELAQYIVDVLDATFPDLGGTVTDAVEARAILAQLATLPVTEQVASIVDRTIPGSDGAHEIPVRIYRPTADQNAVTPVVVFFHGGGFSICDLDTHDGFARSLVNGTGATVVSVDYRLAPETPFPGGLQDSYAATAWVADHAAELGVDPDRLAVAGDSAGGNLAAVVSLMARDRTQRGYQAPKIAYQLLVYPCTDFANSFASREENGTGYFLTTAHMEWFDAQYLPEGADRTDPYLSPLLAPDLSDLPAACVLTAEHDPLRDEGDAYAQRLRDSGVAVEHLRVEGMFHGFVSMPHPAAEKARAAAFAALKAGLS